jgi:hypothetical protein
MNSMNSEAIMLQASCNKVAYPSKRDAAAKRNEILRGAYTMIKGKKRRRRRNRPDLLREYHCGKCGGWHLTSKDKESG